MDSYKKGGQKLSFVRKQYIDPSAGFFYLLGCSLVHFSMFVTNMLVKWPLMNEAKILDDEYDKAHIGTSAKA